MKFYVREEASKTSYSSSKEVYESIRDLNRADQESFWVLGLNSKNKEVLRECVSLGGINSTDIDPRIVFKRLLVAGCTAFIIIHNHPSGDPKPSNEDREITKRLRDGAKILHLVFHDHVIVGSDQYFSFKDGGLM